MKGVGAIASGSFAVANARAARTAYAKLGAAPLVSSEYQLAERAPGGVAREGMARQAAASSTLDALPFHGHTGDIAEVSKETVAQVSSANAYKNYLAVFRPDDEIHGALLNVRA